MTDLPSPFRGRGAQASPDGTLTCDVWCREQMEEAMRWHQAVLEQCMLTEACYVESDPSASVGNLIDWHIRNQQRFCLAGAQGQETGNPLPSAVRALVAALSAQQVQSAAEPKRCAESVLLTNGLFDAIRGLGYTTTSQTHELVDAIEAIIPTRAAP